MVEYDVICVVDYAVCLPVGERSLKDVLNKLSLSGWELIQLIPGKKKYDDEIIIKRNLLK
jgi:hypothetical protein